MEESESKNPKQYLYLSPRKYHQFAYLGKRIRVKAFSENKLPTNPFLFGEPDLEITEDPKKEGMATTVDKRTKRERFRSRGRGQEEAEQEERKTPFKIIDIEV